LNLELEGGQREEENQGLMAVGCSAVAVFVVNSNFIDSGDDDDHDSDYSMC
jgi:hypothetical protein